VAADEKDQPPIPERALRALAKAKAAAIADRKRPGGKALALIPIAIAAIVLSLMMPRAAAPDAVPLPRIDQREVDRIARDDDARARAAEANRLPTDVLAVCGAFREVQTADASGDDAATTDARRRLAGALSTLVPRDALEGELLSLRALQTRRFLDALTAWERSGERTADLKELGGRFLDRAEETGWIENKAIVLTDAERRVVFKTVWNALTGLDAKTGFAPSLDEQRVLYAFYLRRPHPPEAVRGALAAQRSLATTPAQCAKANADEARQTETWRADKIRKLGAIDPTYPTGYALGVAYYRAGRYDLSADAFHEYLEQHPDGPWALRTKNHLKAALLAHGTL
jgi:hypothetical protein